MSFESPRRGHHLRYGFEWGKAFPKKTIAKSKVPRKFQKIILENHNLTIFSLTNRYNASKVVSFESPRWGHHLRYGFEWGKAFPKKTIAKSKVPMKFQKIILENHNLTIFSLTNRYNASKVVSFESPRRGHHLRYGFEWGKAFPKKTIAKSKVPRKFQKIILENHNLTIFSLTNRYNASKVVSFESPRWGHHLRYGFEWGKAFPKKNNSQKQSSDEISKNYIGESQPDHLFVNQPL